MEDINIIGYYKESYAVVQTDNDKLLYFVAFENDNGRESWIEGYNVIDGHFEIKDPKYLISCKKINKDEYLNATKGYYTPKDYL